MALSSRVVPGIAPAEAAIHGIATPADGRPMALVLRLIVPDGVVRAGTQSAWPLWPARSHCWDLPHGLARLTYSPYNGPWAIDCREYE